MTKNMYVLLDENERPIGVVKSKKEAKIACEYLEDIGVWYKKVPSTLTDVLAMGQNIYYRYEFKDFALENRLGGILSDTKYKHPIIDLSMDANGHIYITIKGTASSEYKFKEMVAIIIEVSKDVWEKTKDIQEVKNAILTLHPSYTYSETK